MTFKEEFIAAFKAVIKRKGADELLDWLCSTSFFEDPASTKYHLNRPGGLCEHSIHVYYRLAELCEQEIRRNEDHEQFSDESIAIVGLLHDLCKIGCYAIEQKNVKTYDPQKVAAADQYARKHDAAGDFIWETVQAYRFADPLPYGHGEKSVFLIQKYMTLTDAEALAIRYHMGSWIEGEKTNASKVFESNTLAFLVHTADEMATYLDEREA